MKIEINVPPFFFPLSCYKYNLSCFIKTILIIIKIYFPCFNWSVPRCGSHLYRYINIHWIPINTPTLRPMAFFNVKIVIKITFLLLHQVALKKNTVILSFWRHYELYTGWHQNNKITTISKLFYYNFHLEEGHWPNHCIYQN